MTTITQLAELCTEIVIKPTFKIGEENKSCRASIDCRVSFKSKDGNFQYAQIHVTADSVKNAIERAYKYAKAYCEAEKEKPDA